MVWFRKEWKKLFRKELSYIHLSSMQSIADFVNYVINNYHVDSSIIQRVQAYLGIEMKVDGWISLLLSNREYIVLKCNNGVFMNQGFAVNDDKVLKVFGNHQFGDISYNEEQSILVVEGIVDLDHGSRFEGLVLKDEKEGKIGIPFGYGEMYDDDGLLIYKGIMIDWKRFGYGTSYHDTGLKEYEGYWCDDKRFGNGKVFDRKGDLLKECEWIIGNESNIDYEGNGSEPMNIRMKHLKLTDNCVLTDWDVSWFLNLESIEIGNESFGLVKTFQIDGLNRLKSLKIGNNSFTQKIYGTRDDKSKSFHILNCESLKFIHIGEFSFSDYGGEFELKNLPQLQSIEIGSIGSDSFNFYGSSFVIRGSYLILNIEFV